MSIRHKLLAIISLFLFISLLFLLVLGYVQYSTERQLLVEQRLNRLEQTAYQLSALTYNIVLHPAESRASKQWQEQYQQLGILLQAPLQTAFGKHYDLFVLRDRHTSINALYQRLISIATLPKSALISARRERIVGNILAETQDIVANSISLYDQVTARQQLENRRIYRISLLISVALILLFLGLVTRIKRDISRGFNALYQGIEPVMQGDLSQRVNLHSGDELQHYADTFNRMLIQLDETMASRDALNREIEERKLTEQKLRQYRDELELRVKERTEAFNKSRLAAMSLLEDANHLRQTTEQINQELAKEIQARQASEQALRANQEKLQQAIVDAELASRAKSIFLANMSHELRTPLNAILGFSEILGRDPLLSYEHKENLNIIHKSGDHLLSLINDVLEIAKIEAGRIQLELAPFDLGELILDIIEMLQVRAREKALTLLLDQSSKFPRYIISDAAKLRQVLINLLSNAIKATTEGGVTLRLGVKHNEVEHLIIEVEDTGCGITPEDQARIFEAFIQVGSQSQQQQGTGLGLAITLQFIELMNGKLSLTSCVGQGSTFRLDLPVQLAQADYMPTLPSVPLGEVLLLAPDQPNYRILLVEDQLENQRLLAQLLINVGFEVRIAENGLEAIESFQNWKPHFIWMDRRMPVMDGKEATRRIRALPDGQTVKIAAVTASTFKEEDAQLMEAGFDAIVHKPFRAVQIFECMEQLLGVKFLRAETETAQTEEMSLPDLAALPENLREEFEQALSELDTDRILEFIEQIAQINAPLAYSLNNRAQHFDYESMLKSLQACVK